MMVLRLLMMVSVVRKIFSGRGILLLSSERILSEKVILVVIGILRFDEVFVL